MTKLYELKVTPRAINFASLAGLFPKDDVAKIAADTASTTKIYSVATNLDLSDSYKAAINTIIAQAIDAGHLVFSNTTPEYVNAKYTVVSGKNVEFETIKISLTTEDTQEQNKTLDDLLINLLLHHAKEYKVPVDCESKFGVTVKEMETQMLNLITTLQNTSVPLSKNENVEDFKDNLQGITLSKAERAALKAKQEQDWHDQIFGKQHASSESPSDNTTEEEEQEVPSPYSHSEDISASIAIDWFKEEYAESTIGHIVITANNQAHTYEIVDYQTEAETEDADSALKSVTYKDADASEVMLEKIGNEWAVKVHSFIDTDNNPVDIYKCTPQNADEDWKYGVVFSNMPNFAYKISEIAYEPFVNMYKEPEIIYQGAGNVLEHEEIKIRNADDENIISKLQEEIKALNAPRSSPTSRPS